MSPDKYPEEYVYLQNIIIPDKPEDNRTALSFEPYESGTYPIAHIQKIGLEYRIMFLRPVRLGELNMKTILKRIKDLNKANETAQTKEAS
jgi:hypothetical protein